MKNKDNNGKGIFSTIIAILIVIGVIIGLFYLYLALTK